MKKKKLIQKQKFDMVTRVKKFLPKRHEPMDTFYALFYKSNDGKPRSIKVNIGAMYAVYYNGKDGYEYTTILLQGIDSTNILGIVPGHSERKISILQNSIVGISEFFIENCMVDDNDIWLFYGDKVTIQTAQGPTCDVIFCGIFDATITFIVSRNVQFYCPVKKIISMRAADKQNAKSVRSYGISC